MRRCVGGHVGLLFVRLLLFRAILTTAQSPSFLSIDCGAELGYTDGIGIEWVTDEGYIFTGSNLKSSLTGPPGYEAFPTARYFPEKRNKHCYVLPAAPDATFLVRAVILHGEIPELSLPAKFDVTVNSNDWFTYSATVGDSNIKTPLTYETILYNQKDHIDVCLMEAKEGIPWISSLELRMMPSGTYTLAKTDDKFMDNTWRYNTGTITDKLVRWPDDVFDRVWFPALNDTFQNVKSVSNSTVLPFIDSFNVGFNRPPDAVMTDAFFGPDLTFDNWLVPVGTKEVYVAAYFQDIRNVTATKSNPVGILVGIEGSMYDLNLVDGLPFQVFYHTNVTGTKVNITIVKQPWYTGDAFLNAIEIYQVTDIISTFTLGNDVDALQVVQRSFGLTSWTGDPCYPVSYNWVTCDESNRISGLYLSDKNISGTIPTEIGALTGLREIYLDNNKIGGSIPDSLRFLENLTVLALDNNSLSGGIPNAFQNRTGFTFAGNPNLTLCQPTDTECNTPNPKPKPDNNGTVVGVAVGVSVAVVLGIFLIVVFIRKRKPAPVPEGNRYNYGAPGEGAATFHQSEPNKSPVSTHTGPFENSTIWPTQSSDASAAGDSNLSTKNQLSARASPYQVAGFMSMNEVLIATRNHQRKIGEGGYGPVYYGKLANGKEVAVKVNKIGAHQGNDEFVNEVALLTRVHHKNLVSLLAFCEDGNERVLIYEYQHNGTLSDLLYGPSAESKPLSWKSRLELALNAAKGLEYLHTGCNPRIIHRDIKSSNILIDDKMVAKVADFGISKSSPDQQTTNDGQFSTVVRGTPGYLDPEYYMLQRLSQKSDVYSFGVVLMEIISGRRPISVNPDGSQFNIINLMRQCLQTGDIYSIVDPALNSQFNPESVWKVAEIAWSSVERQGVQRPDMSQVVRGLTEAYDMELSYDPNDHSMDSSFQLSSQRPRS